MSSFSRARLAAAVGATCLASVQPSAHAGFIDYSYTGVVTDQRFQGCLDPAFPCTDALAGSVGKGFSALVRIDTSTGAIVNFSFGISGLPQWAGTGGLETHSTTSLNVDLGSLTGSSTYTSSGPDGEVAIFDGLLNVVGPAGAFGNFIDGYATTFNVGAMTTRGGTAYICGPSYSDFTVNLTAVSGVEVRTTTPTVAEPGTVALAGLAGLAALRSVRRRKAAAA
jgi:MYXO-CTERM domain-containing protein